MLALGAAAGLALTSATRLIANFEQAMSTVRAVTGATEAQFAALTERARELGATTRFTAVEAAEGMIELARAGFTVDEILGSVEGTLRLAQAGNLGLGRASEITAGTLRGMRLEVSETARVVDVLASAANSANTDVNDLGAALGFVSPISAGLGVSLEDTVAALQALADAQFKAEKGGTALRKVMIRLENQSKQGQDILASYGLSMDDVSVSANGLLPVLRKLSEANIGIGEQNILFGDRAGPGFGILTSAIPKIEAATVALSEAAGTADQVAATMDDNLNGAIKRANSALQELTIALGETGATQALESALIGLADLLRLAKDNADILGVAIVALSVRALLPLAKSAVPAAARSIATLAAQLDLIAFKSGRVRAATTLLGATLAGLAGPTAAIAAAAGAYVLLARNTRSAEERLSDLGVTLGKISEINSQIETDTQKLTDANELLTDAIESQSSAAENTARIEVEAIRDRIRENQKLAETYESLARAQLAQTNSQIRSEERRLQRAARQRLNLEGGRRQRQEAVDEFNSDPLAEIERQRQQIIARQEAGLDLSQADTRFLQMHGELQVLRDRAEAARKSIEALGQVVDQVNPRTTEADFELPVENEPTVSDDKEKEAALLQKILRLEFQLDLARQSGDQERINSLEDQLDIIARTQDLIRANVDETKALATAEKQVKELRQASAEALARERAEERLEDRKLKEREFKRAQDFDREQADQELEDQKEEFRRTFKDAFQAAVIDGDVGASIRSVFADQAARGLEDALNSLADQIFQLFSQAFSGSNSNPIGDIFGGIGSFFLGSSSSSASDVASGISVPSTSKIDSVASFGKSTSLSAGKGVTIHQAVNVQGSLDSATLPQVQQMMAEQAKQLPSMIDQRVQESSTRGRYA